MKRKKLYLLLLLMMTLSMACGHVEEAKRGRNSSNTRSGVEEDEDDGEDEEDEDDDDESKKKPGRKSDENKAALMVYIVGSNLESEMGLASKDITEMIYSGYDQDYLDIYLCTGGAKEWHDYGIKQNEVAVYKIVGEELEKLTVLDEKSMAKTATLQSFIDTCYEDTDGNSFDLILWNHGAGSVVGFGSDENDDNYAMTLPEIDKAITGSELVKDGNRFEMIGFDACLMGMIEVACSFNDYANYLVASEELIPGMGWEYKCIGKITDEKDFSGEAMGKIFVDAYAEYYENQFLFKPEYSLTCMDLSKADNVKKSFEDLLSATGDLDPAVEYTLIARCRSNTKAYGAINGEYFYDTVDLYDWAENMKDFYPDEAKTLENSIDDMVVTNKTNIYSTHGVSIYMPYDNKLFLPYWKDMYTDIEFSDVYNKFIEGYTAFLTGEAIAEWNVSNVVAQQDEENEGQYYVQLTDDQAETFARATALIWEKNQDNHDEYTLTISQKDTVLLDDGRLVSNFDNNVFYIRNGAGQEEPITLCELERGDDYVIYRGGLFVYPEDSNGRILSLNVHVKVDEEHPNGEIIGITQTEAVTEDNPFPQNLPYEFQEGDKLQSYIMSRTVTFDDDGKVKQFDDWENNSMTFGGSMEYDGTLEFVCKEEEKAEGSFFCLFYITDIQGNIYSTGAFIADETIDNPYLVSDKDNSFTRDEFYDKSLKQGALYDYYSQQVILLQVPDGYRHSSISDANTWNLRNSDGSIYFNYTVADYVENYLKDGTIPDDEDDFDIKIRKKSKYGNMELWVAEETSFIGTSTVVYIPYLNMYGDQKYIYISSSDLFEDKSDDEIIDLVESFIIK